MNDLLAVLRAARATLAKTYISSHRDDGQGGHCALGAIEYVTSQSAEARGNLDILLALHASIACIYGGGLKHVIKSAFPGVRDKSAVPQMVSDSAWQAMLSIASVNNSLGKAAILAVFDEAIRRLEAPRDYFARAEDQAWFLLSLSQRSVRMHPEAQQAVQPLAVVLA